MRKVGLGTPVPLLLFLSIPFLTLRTPSLPSQGEGGCCMPNSTEQCGVRWVCATYQNCEVRVDFSFFRSHKINRFNENILPHFSWKKISWFCPRFLCLNIFSILIACETAVFAIIFHPSLDLITVFLLWNHYGLNCKLKKIF